VGEHKTSLDVSIPTSVVLVASGIIQWKIKNPAAFPATELETSDCHTKTFSGQAASVSTPALKDYT